MIKTVLLRLFVTQYTGYSFLIGVLCGLLAFFLDMPFLYPLFFVLITNTFDMLGYGNIMDIVHSYDSTVYHTVLPYYRIMQKMFNYLLMVGIIYLVTDSWLVTLACFLANCGGFQDVLFYLFGKYNFNQSYTWLRWTPCGWFMKQFDKWVFVGQGVVTFGLITTALIIF